MVAVPVVRCSAPMADTDPFGREKTEDPLAEMGWSTEGAIAPGAGPADVASPEQADRAVRRRTGEVPRVAPPAVPGTRRRRGAGCAFSVVVVGFVIAVFAVVVPTVLDVVDDIDDAIPTVPSPAPDRPPPRGLEERSMLRRGNLAPALRDLRRITGGSRIALLRVDAESVLVTVLVGGDRMRVARDAWDDEPAVLSTSPAGGVAGTAFAWDDVDASAPNRIVRAATRGRDAREFDYLVLLEGAGLRWSAFVKNGARFSASPDGSEVTPAG